MNSVRLSATDALRELQDGNGRFVGDDRCIDTYLRHTKLDDHLEGQAPYAIVLGCSDSRVPVEIIFDVGLGDLFVIRVAGNVVTPSLIGSVELAAEKFGPRLVVVLGHTGCGAVDLTLNSVQQAEPEPSGHVNTIIERIRPAVEGVIADEIDKDRDELMRKSVRANVRSGAEQLRHGSGILGQLIRDDGLMVVGAEYSIETGVVEFFDGLPLSG